MRQLTKVGRGLRERRRGTELALSEDGRINIKVNQQRLEQPLPKPRTDHSTQTRSLRSRSRIDWAVEAARRVRGELVVAGLQVDGLRGGAGAPTDAGGERPTC